MKTTTTMRKEEEGGKRGGGRMRNFNLHQTHVVFFVVFILWGASAFTASALPSAETTKDTTRKCGSVEIVGTHQMRSMNLSEIYKRCQVMEGHLRIQMIDGDYYKSEEALVNALGFPDLIQVTGYVLIHGIAPLKTLDSLFPNLSVIRGQELFHGYSLVVYGNVYLERLGLNNLTDILNGSIRIEKNWLLCPGMENRWDNVIKANKTKEDNNLIGNNYIMACIYHPCESTGNCSTVTMHHYKICLTVGDGCYQGPQCHAECAGGCRRPNDPTACIACRHFDDRGTCVDSCVHHQLYDGSDQTSDCTEEPKCDGRTQKQNVSNRGPRLPACNRCKKSSCSKEQCIGNFTITSSNLGKKLRDCVIINGSLTISVAGGKNITQQLETNLKNIKHVTGYIRVYGSSTLYSFNFLKSLESIGGEDKMDDKYAFHVLENEYLQELWDEKKGPRKLTIGNNASFFFHYNPRLCHELIRKVVIASNMSEPTTADVSQTTNGQSQPCYKQDMDAKLIVDKGKIIVVWKDTYTGFDSRFVIGYDVFYREAPHDVTLFGGRDACNDEQLWHKGIFTEYNKKPNRTVSLTNLNHYTRYAVYIAGTYTTKVQNGSRSHIMYAKTPPIEPSSIGNIARKARSHNALSLEWGKPDHPNGDLAFYLIKYEKVGRPSIPRNKNCEPCNRTCAIDPLQMKDEYDNQLPNSNYNHNISSISTTTKAEVEASSYPMEVKNSDSLSKCCACTDNYQTSSSLISDREQIIMIENIVHRTLYGKMDDDDDDEKTKNRSNHNTSNKPTMDDTSAMRDASTPGNMSTTTIPSTNLQEVEKKSDKDFTDRPNPMEETSTNLPTTTEPNDVSFKLNEAKENGGQVNSSYNSITLISLHHYSIYKISIKACNTGTNNTYLCSEWKNYSASTTADRDKDQIKDFTVTIYEEKETDKGEMTKTRNEKMNNTTQVTLDDNEQEDDEESVEDVEQEENDEEGDKETGGSQLASGGEGKNTSLSSSSSRSSSGNTFSPDDVHKGRNKTRILRKKEHPQGNTFLLKWSPPEDPNGAILSYNFRVIDTSTGEQGQIRGLRCISEKAAKEANYTHKLDILNPGKYNISMQLLSEGGYGEFTMPQTVTLKDSYVVWIITGPLFCGMMLGMCIIQICLWYQKRKRGPEAKERCISINDHYGDDTNERFGEILKCTLGKIKEKYVIHPCTLEIDFEKKLGSGKFGVVYQGLLKETSGNKRIVAVKDLNKDGHADKTVTVLQEVYLMQDINSHFIVPLVGFMTQIPHIYMAMELMERGSLKSYLESEDNKGRSVPEEKIIEMAVEVADGMAYLASKQMVHRDLAARNCMLDANLSVKIGDFGLTRRLADKDYYRPVNKSYIPVRWMAPESLRDGICTTRSDIWSYGVLLWEICTMGKQPYHGNSTDMVYNLVCQGTCLEKPTDCSDFMYSLMHQCWKFEAKKRLTFMQLIELLLPRTSKQFQTYLESVSYFHKNCGRDSESTEDNDEGFNNSGSLDPSLDDNGHEGDHSFPDSIPLEFHHVDDDQGPVHGLHLLVWPSLPLENVNELNVEYEDDEDEKDSEVEYMDYDDLYSDDDDEDDDDDDDDVYSRV